MIRKHDKNLLSWINDNLVDLGDENNFSGLTWDSSREEVLKFLRTIPAKEKVQKYGIYVTNYHFITVEEFSDVEYCLRGGFISENTCKIIIRWNREVGRENWTLEDVRNIIDDYILVV